MTVTGRKLVKTRPERDEGSLKVDNAVACCWLCHVRLLRQLSQRPTNSYRAKAASPLLDSFYRNAGIRRILRVGALAHSRISALIERPKPHQSQPRRFAHVQ